MPSVSSPSSVIRRQVRSQSPLVIETTSASGPTSPRKPSATLAKYFEGGASTTTSAPSAARARSDSSRTAAGSSTPGR